MPNPYKPRGQVALLFQMRKENFRAVTASPGHMAIAGRGGIQILTPQFMFLPAAFLIWVLTVMCGTYLRMIFPPFGTAYNLYHFQDRRN